VLVEATRRTRDCNKDRTLPCSEGSAEEKSTVRIEHEQTTAIGGIGKTLAAARAKSWDDGPWVTVFEQEALFSAR
jgi:hypothetical protein